MSSYYAAPPPAAAGPQRPAVDLDDLFGGPSAVPKPPAPADPAPPSYDALNGGYASSPPPPSPPHAYAASSGNYYGGAAQAQSHAPPPPPPQQQQQQPQHYPPQQPQQSMYHAAPPHGYAHADPSPYAAPAQQPHSPAAAAAPPQPYASPHPSAAPAGAYGGYPAGPASGMVPQGYAQPQPQASFTASNSSSVNGGAAAGAGPAIGAAAVGGATAAAPARSAEEEDRLQLERIIRLRRVLEQEQEREQRKKDELQTWGCPVCTFRNKLAEVKCDMCGSTRPGYSAAAASRPAQQQQQQQPPQQQPQAARPAATSSAGNAGITAWQCGMCLAPNEAHAERCKVCYAYRSSGTPVPTTGAPGTNGGASGHLGVVSNTPFTTNWRCSVCGEVNPPSKANCKVCNGFQRNGTPAPDAVLPASTKTGGGAPAGSADPPLPTVWSCSVCTFENPVSAAVCTACESGQRPRHLAPRKEKSASSGKPHGQSRSSGPRDGAEGGSAANAAAAAAAPSSKKSGSAGKTQWPCGTCTFLNPIGRKKCDMCGAKRPEAYAAAADTTEARAVAKQEAQDDAEEVEWQDDNAVTECNNCHSTFTFLMRRHHCRMCGFVFCAHCSNYAVPLTMNSLPQRVCVNCYKVRLEEEKKTKKSRRWLEE